MRKRSRTQEMKRKQKYGALLGGADMRRELLVDSHDESAGIHGLDAAPTGR